MPLPTSSLHAEALMDFPIADLMDEHVWARWYGAAGRW